MKKKLLAVTALAIGASFSSAAQKTTTGTITSENSVNCGTKTA
jgi:hypothetical protein